MGNDITMNVRLEYQPKNLSFDEFQQVDIACFPQEPLDPEVFLRFCEHDFWAAYDSMKFIGYGYAVRKPDVTWLSRICVRPSYRQRGIASQILQTVIEHARKIGSPDVLLYVQSDNPSAVRLYERYRFQVIESAYQFILKDLQQFPSMQKAGMISAVPIVEIEQSRWPVFPREWVNIAMMHQPPEQHVLLFFDGNGENHGYCRLTPRFPGCFPFVVDQPAANLVPVLQALQRYQPAGKEGMILTLSDDKLAHVCKSLGMKLNYQLYKMIRYGKADEAR